MRQRLKLFLSFALFWLGFQILVRIAFVGYNAHLASSLDAGEIFLSFVHGMKMDASISGYFLAVTGLLLAISVFTRKGLVAAMTSIVVSLLLVSCLIVVVDLELYRHWGFRLNTTPLFYAGSEAMGSVPMPVVLKLMVIFVLIFSAGGLMYMKFLLPALGSLQPTRSKKTFLVMLILTGLMFVPIRGSFTVAPMNTGFVYFHKSKMFANHAAINVVWNFLYSVRASANVSYPENFFDAGETEILFRQLYETPDTTVMIMKTTRPNVVLIILESFTADVVESLGGIKGVAPNLTALSSEGILFDNFYASGDRTDKGIISILSGYPAQPRTSIIKYPAKTQSLPYLNHRFRELGYHTSFVYGGDIDFANFRSYITASSFDHITTEDDFPSEWNTSKWGVHDHFVMDRAFSECDTASTPFFKVILTLSSHEPFDVPMTSRFAGTDETSLFLNSCHYTDSTIGTFIDRAKQTGWWKNTVVAFVADHGHRLPYNKEAKDRERYRIPFLLVGGAITGDSTVDTFGGQTDIAATLLAQLGVGHKEFTFSRNLLTTDTTSFAAYYFNDGFGFVTPHAYAIHDNTAGRFIRQEGADEKLLNQSRALQQKLYSDYNNR